MRHGSERSRRATPVQTPALSRSGRGLRFLSDAVSRLEFGAVTLPTGTVTFFFTDIEGSTGLLRALGHETYGHLQDAHSVILRGAIDQGSGVEIRTEGDAFFAVFGSPAGAVLAATEAQRGLATHDWPDG